jgi:hypothetical protein
MWFRLIVFGLGVFGFLSWLGLYLGSPWTTIILLCLIPTGIWQTTSIYNRHFGPYGIHSRTWGSYATITTSAVVQILFRICGLVAYLVDAISYPAAVFVIPIGGYVLAFLLNGVYSALDRTYGFENYEAAQRGWVARPAHLDDPR